MCSCGESSAESVPLCTHASPIYLAEDGLATMEDLGMLPYIDVADVILNLKTTASLTSNSSRQAGVTDVMIRRYIQPSKQYQAINALQAIPVKIRAAHRDSASPHSRRFRLLHVLVRPLADAVALAETEVELPELALVTLAIAEVAVEELGSAEVGVAERETAIVEVIETGPAAELDTCPTLPPLEAKRSSWAPSANP